MLKIVINTKDMETAIVLKNKYTIIRGNSGTGKSYNYKVIKDIARKQKGVTVRLSNPAYRIYYHDNISTKLFETAKTEEFVLFLDEDNIVDTEVLRQLVNITTKAYFVFITRDNLASIINYGVDDIYELVYTNKRYTLAKAYMLDKCKDKVDSSYTVVSEDSTAGKEFYTALFRDNLVLNINNNGVPSGKDYLLTFLEKLSKTGNKKYILFIDWCSFGSLIDRLFKFVEAKSIKVVVAFRALSFEYILLNTSIVNYRFKGDEVLQYISTERCYEDILDKATADKVYNIKHNSGKPLPMHFKSNFNHLLIGTEFEGLLVISGRK